MYVYQYTGFDINGCPRQVKCVFGQVKTVLNLPVQSESRLINGVAGKTTGHVIII